VSTPRLPTPPPPVAGSSLVALAECPFEAAAAMMGRAFHADPLMVLALPAAAHRARAVPAVYGGILRYARRYGRGHALPDGSAMACWLPPGASSPTFPRMLRAGMLAIPVALGLRAYLKLDAFERHAEALHRKHAPGRHWYLWAIGVDPTRKGRGLGRALLAPVLAEADAERLPCYLETQNPGNLPFYTGLGFELLEASPVPGHGLAVHALMRPPA
jgi:ribosomal protein S18 acetylase RimI-like enzyme